MSFPPAIPGSSQQPVSIPSSANSNHSHGSTGTSFPRQTDYGGPSQQGGPSRWDGQAHVQQQNGGGGMVSGISALMRSRGNDDYQMMASSPPGGAHSSLSSNPHSGFHPSSFGPNLPFSALALGVSMHNGPGSSYLGGNNMGMSISPPHWGSLGSGSFVGSVGGAFGTSLNREREGRERELEAKYVRDFTCCGKKLNGLHELLEHYEEEHANLAPDVRMAAINAAQSSMNTAGPSRNVSNPFSTMPPTPTSIGQQPPNQQHHHHHHQSDVPAPPGMMDIEMEEPPYPAAASGSLAQLQQQQQQQQQQLAQQQQQPFAGRPLGFNTIATNPWAAAFRPQMIANQNTPPQCVPPSLLSYAPPTPGPSTPGGSSSAGAGAAAALTPEQLQAKALRKAQRKAEKAAREEASPDDAEGEKRFPCPIEGCGKVYKQANGLKYHLTRSINSGHGNVAALGGLAALLGEKGEADG
ncbi:hypothetical protein IAU59_005895 [Kwoniella sp. CBS 9459]